MDDRTWRLAVGTLASAVVVVLVDAALADFDVPAGFWTVLAASLGFLGARAAIRGRNGNGNGAS